MINRYYPVLFGLILGIAVGLLYGWVIRPIQIVESTPNTLRDDYQTDLILMIAEAYENEKDLDLALQRFEFMDLEPPVEILQAAITYSQDHDFKVIEVQRLDELLDDLSTFNAPR
jgi:hypothetical protein